MIKNIKEFIEAIQADSSSSWLGHVKEPKWFRGESESVTPLLPTLYRAGFAAHENPLLQMFRARASGYHDVVPEVERTDQWLFLARHVGLPTRLLDWTEGALIALHFALQKEHPVVWMLNPHELNRLSMPSDPLMRPDPSRIREFPLTWFRRDPPLLNPAYENIRGAWELDQPGVELPIVVYPTYVHARLRAQRSCFTIHGKRKEGLNTLVSDSILKRYLIDPTSRETMRDELRLLGVTDAVAFPDLGGLARELTAQFL
jgi:hypothetical protein